MSEGGGDAAVVLGETMRINRAGYFSLFVVIYNSAEN